MDVNLILTPGDILGGIIIGTIILYIVGDTIYTIVSDYCKEKLLGYKDCYKCKHHYLENVSSVGGVCWYACRHKSKDEVYDKTQSSCNYKLRKCNLFEESTKENKSEE